MADPNLTLLQSDRIVDNQGRPTLPFVAKWQRLLRPRQLAVLDLPTNGKIGDWAYSPDLRVFDGAGTQEGAGLGTGGLVSFNGTDWVIAGTNVVASA